MINTRTYSLYSLKYSMASIEKIVEKAVEDGDTHVAILDKYDLYSLIYLQKACNEHNIQPIIGYEFNDFITLWPKNNDGLKEINKLLLLESKDRTKTLISQYKFKNVIAVTNSLAELPDCKLSVGKDNTYLEYEYGQMPKIQYQKLIPACRVLYNEQKDALGHDYFINYVWKDDRHESKDTFYIKQFKDVNITEEEKKALKEFAANFSIKVELNTLKMPKYDTKQTGENSDPYSWLLKLCNDSLIKLVNDNPIVKNKLSAYKERLLIELKDIKETNLAPYFLIVKDICDWARANGIKKGKGRGSAAGSLVCYLTNITGIDPIEHHLIWERFYNIGRKGSLPDIDTDFEAERRNEVIEYIRERFGRDKVFNIITFGSMGPKKAIKAVLSVAGCSFEEQNQITALIWHKATTIDEALAHSDKLREEMNKRKAMLAIAKQIEGALESFGKHAAGIIISNESFYDGNIPMTWHPDDEEYISGMDLDAIEALGLLKIDILGLNTLNIIKDVEQMVTLKTNKQFNIDNIDYLDKDVYENIFHNGKTKCVFQLESQVGQKYAELAKPNNIDEVADVVTIIRPGSMVPKQTDKYLEVRGGADPAYPHKDLEDVLGDTYGACIYQEQIIKLCVKFAGMELKKADSVRAAAGKKKKKLMESLKDEFVNGCIKNSHTKELAELLWSWIVEFSGYSFNKSHAVSYAYAAYETAYLKYYYPIEFFIANLNRVVGDIHRSEFDKISEIVNDAKLYDITIVPPSVKTGNALFESTNQKTIVYGLDRIKGVGSSSIPVIRECGQSTTYDEFIKNAFEKGLRKDVIEALISCGALDCYKTTRHQMLADFKLLEELTDREYVEITKSLGQSINVIIQNMIDENNVVNRKLNGLIVPNVRRREKLKEVLKEYQKKDKYETILHIARYEKEFLGCSLSANEADSMFANITHSCMEIKNLPAKTKVKTSIVLSKVKEIETKKGKHPGQKMAFLTGGDASYELNNIVIFPDPYKKFSALLKEGNVLFLDGVTGDNGGLIVNRMVLLK